MAKTIQDKWQHFKEVDDFPSNIRPWLAKRRYTREELMAMPVDSEMAIDFHDWYHSRNEHAQKGFHHAVEQKEQRRG